MGSAILIPDRRRRHLPLNGGPRPTRRHAEVAHKGLAAAREALTNAATAASDAEPERVHKQQAREPMSSEQISRARQGLENARKKLVDATAPLLL